MTTEDFAVQLMWLLIFLMIFVGSLCLLDVLFRPRRRRGNHYRDMVAERHQQIREAGLRNLYRRDV